MSCTTETFCCSGSTSEWTARPPSRYDALMIKRLLMIVLIACLAIPAVAAPLCHSVGQPSPVAVHHGGHHDSTPTAPWEKAQLIHGCIGCIAPLYSSLQPRELKRMLAIPKSSSIAHGLPRSRDGPDTPPPRFA